MSSLDNNEAARALVRRGGVAVDGSLYFFLAALSAFHFLLSYQCKRERMRVHGCTPLESTDAREEVVCGEWTRCVMVDCEERCE